MKEGLKIGLMQRKTAIVSVDIYIIIFPVFTISTSTHNINIAIVSVLRALWLFEARFWGIKLNQRHLKPFCLWLQMTRVELKSHEEGPQIQNTETIEHIDCVWIILVNYTHW